MADKKTTDEDLAGPILGNELIRIVQGGVNKKVAVNSLPNQPTILDDGGGNTLSNNVYLGDNLGTTVDWGGFNGSAINTCILNPNATVRFMGAYTVSGCIFPANIVTPITQNYNNFNFVDLGKGDATGFSVDGASETLTARVQGNRVFKAGLALVAVGDADVVYSGSRTEYDLNQGGINHETGSGGSNSFKVDGNAGASGTIVFNTLDGQTITLTTYKGIVTTINSQPT